MFRIFHQDATGKTLAVTLEQRDTGKFWNNTSKANEALNYADQKIELAEGANEFTGSYSTVAVEGIVNGHYIQRIHDEVSGDVIALKVLHVQYGDIYYESGTGRFA